VGTLLGIYRPYPPLYYEKRIEIMRSKIAANPKDADAYDNMAVAYARLNRPDDALAAIESKKAAIGSTPGTTPDWYRFYSNRGSFYLMKWAGSKDKKAALPILDKGISDIENALKIDVNAHFGREKYQLLFMKWLRERTLKPSPPSQSPEFNATLFAQWLDDHGAGTMLETEIGLAGLIRLGTAWENADIVEALHQVLALGRLSSIAALSQARLYDIQSINPKSSFTGSRLVGVQIGIPPDGTLQLVRDLQLEAMTYLENRDQFVIEKLKAGKHPDTDPSFWDGAPVANFDYGSDGRLMRLGRVDAWNPWVALVAMIGILHLGVVILIKLARLLRRLLNRRRIPPFPRA
jgi:tetratricopeptide (TPR) repeat protein